ncbi:hypothetical protein DXG03_001418 [Asterophora parasitica]|uniref:PH domain-containing protein n=1 Tax=Asterophora parasitica TaxID=117018 RepID=A0A9P7GBJ8_9AGAR|nr:hypothetical protein DXG03_001418 [Asterophora parasitica]
MPATLAPLQVPRKSSFFDFKQKRERSPIRQSFRNLLTVFKKVNGRKEKQEEGRPLSSFRRQLEPVEVDFPRAPPVLRSRSRKLESSLLYLSRTPKLPSKSPILPVWTPCTATLESDKIVISGLTAHGNPSVHTILLSNCTDVRSLAMQQLNAEESALLPKRHEMDEFKVFEILFEGRPREKFAANSVQERAGWVSAVWDTILPSQYQDPPVPDNVEDVSPAAADSRAKETNSSHSDRVLPPIPMNTKPQVPHLAQMLSAYSQASSSSPRIYPASSRPVSPASSAGNSRPSSPSIVNLSQLSAVRKRLAQIEPTSSHSSHDALTSPTSSAGASYSTRLTTPTLRSEKGSIRNLTEDMMRSQSEQSRADSILDSYGDSPTVKAPHSSPVSFQSIQKSTKAGSDRKRSSTKASPLSLSRLDTVVELFHDLSAKNYDQTADLGVQVMSLHNDVQRLPREIASAIDMGAHSNNVTKLVAKLEEQVRANGETLGAIHDKMEVDRKRRRKHASDDNVKLTQGLQSIQEHISKELAVIGTKLDSAELRDAAAANVVDLNNLAASRAAADVTPPVVDLSGLHAKMDDILAISNNAAASAKKNNGASQSGIDASKLEEMLTLAVALFQKDANQQAIQAHQQVESVRYLNELNAWLEAFVNNGTSQIQILSNGVNQLCRDLGSGEEGGSAVLADLRKLALSTAARDQSSVALQASIDGLSAMLNEQSVSTNVATITSLIGRQRRDHEGLMRMLTSEITEEIKGERLRFVEAMKEATAINVQIHVEQFKKELKREVVEMTEEVGRLHQDRQAMQNQIADLFTFHTKQKAAEQLVSNPSKDVLTQPEGQFQPARSQPTPHAMQAHPRSMGRRPLPQPRR